MSRWNENVEKILFPELHSKQDVKKPFNYYSTKNYFPLQFR